MSDVMIDIKNLTKIYNIYDAPMDRLKEALNNKGKQYHREFYALNNINLSISKGEIVGFVGRNGAGKSTLLKLITGIIDPTQGSVVTNGTISALLELGTGFNPEYTGMQNIYLYGTMLGKTHEEIDEELDNIISFANIGDFINQPVKSYSSGMFARLAFSVAVNVQPDILIVDEILAVGDLDFQLKCMDRMKQMMMGGTTVLFVSHDVNSIKRFCTRCVWIKKGMLIEDGNVDDVTDDYLDDMRLEESNKLLNKDETIIQEENDQGVKQNISVKVKVLEFKLLNASNLEVNVLSGSEIMTVEVIYEVFDASVESPVLGIAIRSIDDEYMCGLATSLDKIEIPWKQGVNKFYLKYDVGMLLIGGAYYFDIGFFDKTGTVNILYVSKIKEFKVRDRYHAEGRFILPHTWMNLSEEIEE